jgi:hypothetical protein
MANLLGHSIPLPVPDLVLRDIVELVEEKQQNHHAVDANQDSVSALIERLVVIAVYVCRNDTPDLSTHYERLIIMTHEHIHETHTVV